VQVPRCSWQSKALDEVPYKLSGAVAKLANITFGVWLLPLRIDKPWFLTEGKSAAVLIIPSSWGSQLDGDLYIYTVPHQAYFLASLPGRKKKTSARGVSHAHPLLCFKFCFTLFLLASFYQKDTKKLVSFIVAFIYLLLVLLK
jgi:hypothetical protein